MPNNLRRELGDEIAELRLALIVRCLRRGRPGEFLEARIIPERINIGSSRSSAGVTGTFGASWLSYGIESNFCKAAIARPAFPAPAATRARISICAGPNIASFSIGIAALARSPNLNAAALSLRPHLVIACDSK